MNEPPPGGAGRPSAVQPEVRLERRVGPFFALLFYGFLILAAWVWLDRGFRSGLAEAWIPRNWPMDVAIGLGGGLLFVALTPLVTRWSAPARELEREFGWILGEQKAWEIVLLALLSGVAEEFLFRGAMYRAVGPVMSTVVFAAVHWPVNWSFRLWPFLALAAGSILALERHATGTLLAPAITHVLVNLVNLFRITRKYRVWKE